MIDTNVLRVLSAKGASDNLLKKLCIWIGDMDCTLDDICSNRKLMCSLGINKDVAENIYKAKELALYLKDRLSKDGIDMLWCGDYDLLKCQ